VRPKASKVSLICGTEPRLNFIKDVPNVHGADTLPPPVIIFGSACDRSTIYNESYEIPKFVVGSSYTYPKLLLINWLPRFFVNRSPGWHNDIRWKVQCV